MQTRSLGNIKTVDLSTFFQSENMDTHLRNELRRDFRPARSTRHDHLFRLKCDTDPSRALGTDFAVIGYSSCTNTGPNSRAALKV
jgi:hypothetical protein